MEFFYLVKATQKSGKPDAVVWLSANTQSRAALQLDVALEDAGIETGRGKDYAKPVRTDMPVVDDLPEEGVVCFEFCKRYALADDQRTWNVIPGATSQGETVLAPANLEDVDDVDQNDNSDGFESKIVDVRHNITPMPFRIQLLTQFTAEERHVYHINNETRAQLASLELDTDNTYVQNLLLAAENVQEVKAFDMPTLWRLTEAVKKVFPQDKRHELNKFIQFVKDWVATAHVDRGIHTSVDIPNDQKSEEPQPSEAYKRAVPQNMANLSIEIAIALLYPDAVPGKINRAQLMAAKELADKKDEAHSRALKVLGKTSDITDYNAESIFGIARALPWSGEVTTVELRKQVREWFTANGIYENGERSKGYPEWDEDPRAGRQSKVEKTTSEEVSHQLAADRGEFVEGISDPEDPKWVKENLTASTQPQVANLGGGVFSIEGLMNENQPQTDDRSPVTEETTSDVQMEETDPAEGEAGNPVQPGESADAADPQTDALSPAEVLAAVAPELSVAAAENDENSDEWEVIQEPPAPEYPAYFEPGRYEGLPNNVYHAANGISSTQVKDARVSLMYFNARHVAKTIPREGSKVLDMGNLVHALALQPENLDEEFSVEPVIPEGAFTTAATLRTFIDEHNATLPALLSADDIKALLEEHNATLPAQLPMGGSAEETYASYEQLPEVYQRIENGTKHTATAMKACIKEYNTTLPAQVKTSGSRDALLEQLAIINPDLVAQEAQKPAPLKVSGTKAEMIQAVKSVKPDAVFADELLDAWRENPGDKILVTHQQMETALAIQKALHEHPTAGKLLLHPDRAVETSYFGIDEETGLEIRVRPDIEIPFDMVRVGADLKTISMWNVKQSGLRARLHREIIDRDYHLSAAMYMQTAALDQFFWIFVNKDEGYHWIAIVEASEELIELGMLEYRQTMNRIANAFDTGVWPAPITEDYTDELNDFDLRRLEALRTQA
ncbi:PD-(D/E)XK nuclease-like domain-containing protein [Leclercia adecarboxylata]|uniref:RecE family exodeoxyribonuclease n=1 Tax=Leclercia adecarboxylata TaxID=83655 RepID=UPI002DB6FB7B|nr:RecE family exodeoxyribonuclease [Leclercia adecarboxylata]MEB5748462.1 PD-(D/E)XK nuclease-like domain-containing protein [Leclercia adecarboxylata]